ncbi:hypothetical protein VOLCADRAFT_103689 [Volvox carteri f. nagariensis]|uniref:UBC core domain-containing protein n=1 Tax=Volvox carteri f. nagariensis TaxID=3068 RepID=D8TNT5_VOLCA|nr:uncharacterized protein VOLCADRAFT_103689 [Volvox carteri f. nagariensis]EFJ51048.1 hypothetical protein VOLCADRAFT_103689 [Volvox carteri f. nagariensis]|eukprot:XP_002948060.1 hypothetical protein VOLCADRAFT_103689 [Volvox carteri f. nagariensis]
MSTGQGGGHLDQSFFRIATECAGVLKDFCRGQRAKAKKALQRLAQDHPNSFLPHRYLARLLYHESARVEADQQVSCGTLPSHRRLALLHSALLEAKQASELAPGSLSSAALRATLLVNLLVEESALQGGLAKPQEEPLQPSDQVALDTFTELSGSGSSAAPGSGDVAWYQLQPEARCEAIKREFREAIAHCVRTLECNTPLLVEPVITISDAHARTCDPCCLRVQDSIVEWVKQDNWQRIVAEKRSVLACMHQVLESCHTLLDSTHIPVDGIVRLLQHILRPHQQDLQLWASQLLLSKGSVDDLQHKFETQAAVTELLRMLRPGRPSEELTAGVGASQPGLTQLCPAAVQMHASASAALPQAQIQQTQQQPMVASVSGQVAAAPAEVVMAGRVGSGTANSQPLPPPPQQELAACLSAEQEWDEVREGITMPSVGAGVAGAGSGGRRAGGKVKNKTKGNDAARGTRKERSRYERYMDVETFWRTTSPEQRRELLKVPMAALLKGVRREQGNDAVDELIEGLVLLREQGNRAACYWLCPVCEQKFHSSRDFLGHVEMVHEGLAVQARPCFCGLGADAANVSHAQGQGQQQYGLESSSAQQPLKFGEASDEWLAPFPAASLSAPLMVPDPRAGLPVPSGPATLPPSHAPGTRLRGKRSSGGSDVSADSILGQSLHSRSLSEPANQGRQAGEQGHGEVGTGSSMVDDGTDAGGAGSSSATWRSWWPTRLMQGWAGKGQQQQGPGQQPQQPAPGSLPSVNARDSGRQEARQPNFDGGGPPGALRFTAKAPSSPKCANDSGTAVHNDGVSHPLLAAGGLLARAGHAAGATELVGVDGFGGRMNGMVVEVMTRLREIYLTDRDLGDTTLGHITQFVYRKLGAGAAADDLNLASCPPGPRAVLLEFLSQPSIVFQRPQALAVVLGLLPLADLQIVAAYAVRQHENAVSGMEAAARDIAAGSDEDGNGAQEEEDECDGTGGGVGGSGSEQEYQLDLAARLEAARVAAAEAAVASHLAAPMPRARRRLRYTSRRAPAGATAAQQSSASLPPSSSASQCAAVQSQLQQQHNNTGPGTPPLPPHACGSLHIGGSHALSLNRVNDDASAEEVSEEEMESAVDGVEYTLGPDGEALRGMSPHHSVATADATMSRSHQHQLEQLRHAGGGGVHLVTGAGAGVNAILCDDERSMEGSLVEDGDEEVSEDVEGAEEELSEEEDGVSLVPDDEDEEEDGPCVSLFNVAGDVELGFDRLITQMWGGGAENDDAAVATLDQQTTNTGNASTSGHGGSGGNSSNRNRSQQQGNRGGRNQQQGRQQSPTSRSGGANSAAAAVPGGPLSSVVCSAGAVGLPDDPVLAEELVGPREDEPYLVVADWWLQHLRLNGGGPVPDELRVLRWVYGNIINVQAEEFCARQRELRGGRDRDTAILDLYDEVAAVWRSLQAVTDKRSRLEALRRAARGHFAVVRRLEEAGGHATLDQATEFLDAVLSGYCQGQQSGAATGAGTTAGPCSDAGPSGPPEQPGTPTTSEAVGTAAEGPASGTGAAVTTPAASVSADTATATASGSTVTGPSGPLLYLCERAVEVVRRHPALAQEPSQRYATALLERELSVLALVEVMVAAEAEDAARERGVAEESLKRHRAEHRDAEAEYQRVQAEGPASHRKKDLLDKATKEAEHREQLRELAARLASLSDSIAADEGNKTRYAEKQDEAERELAYVRDAIRQTSARRASLLDVCATLDVPFAPPPPHHPRAHLQQRLNRSGPGGGGSGVAPVDQVPVNGSVAASFPPSDADVCSAAMALGPPSGGGLAAAAADMEWRATRLECLMYRVLWVSEAVKMFQPQYNPRPTTHHYNLFIRATHWAKQLSEEYEESIRAYCCELERLRARLRDVAAVDLGYEIGAAALEVVRRRIEAAARAAREAASLTLLKELEEEEERRKAALAAAKDAKDAGGGAAASSSKKAGANKKAAKASQDSRNRAQKEKERELARQVEEEARRRAEEEDKERVAAARRAREAALEAELERRRRELEELEAQREAEAIRAAQEASLREQQLREQREREQREGEQRERELREEQREKAEKASAAAVLQAQANVPALTLQQQQPAAAGTVAGQRAGVVQPAAGQTTTGGRKQEAAGMQLQMHQQVQCQPSNNQAGAGATAAPAGAVPVAPLAATSIGSAWGSSSAGHGMQAQPQPQAQQAVPQLPVPPLDALQQQQLPQPPPQQLQGSPAAAVPSQTLSRHAAVDGVSVPDFNPFAENPVFKALAMDAKAPQPASPSGAAVPVALAGAAGQGPSQQVQLQQGAPRAPSQLPSVQPHPDALLAGIPGSQSGSAVPNPEADTHIKSIMSILDQDGQSPSAGSGLSAGMSHQGTGPGARASPGGTSRSTQSGQASQTPTANSSPQRALMPPAPPPGPPALLYGNPYGMAGAAGGPPLLLPGTDGSPGAGGSVGRMATVASPSAASRSHVVAQVGVLPNGSSMGLCGVGGNTLTPSAMGNPSDGLGNSAGGAQPGVLAGLPTGAAFSSAIWRPGSEQLAPGSQLPMGMLGLGLGLGCIGAGPNTWGSVGLNNATANMPTGIPRSSSAVMASPRQVSNGGTGEWGGSPVSVTSAGVATASATAAGAGRDNGMTLPDSVDTLVASLPSSLLPGNLDSEPAPPRSPGVAAAVATSGLAPTAAPFYPASLRGKVSHPAGGGVAGGGMGNGSMIQQQQLGGSAGMGIGMGMGMGMGMGAMGLAAMSGDNAAVWMSGIVSVPGKQSAAAGAVAGAAAAAAAAAVTAAGNGLVTQGQHTGQQQLSGSAGMAALPGVMCPGGIRYMGLYNGDGVNWSHGGMMPTPGVMGCSASPVDESNLMVWQATVSGPDETEWESAIQTNHHDAGSRLTCSIRIVTVDKEMGCSGPHHSPPCLTHAQHVFIAHNVYQDGSLCMDVLQDQWSPCHNVSTLLTSIQSLLTDPNCSSPANPEAANLYLNDRAAYKKRVRRIAQKSLENC